MYVGFFADYYDLAYPGVIMRILLTRKMSYHLMQTYVPSTIFVSLAWLSIFIPPEQVPGKSLFVFSICGPKQNATSLLTSVSDTVFNALSHSTLSFAVHGSFFNHFLIGQHFSTTNQNL